MNAQLNPNHVFMNLLVRNRNSTNCGYNMENHLPHTNRLDYSCFTRSYSQYIQVNICNATPDIECTYASPSLLEYKKMT